MTPPTDWATTIGMIAATLAATLGCVAVLRRVRGGAGSQTPERVLTIAATAIGAAVFVYRMIVVHETWAPLHSQVDGLALLVGVLGLVLVYLQWTRRLPGVSIFALGALALMCLWGVCASWWTARAFRAEGIVNSAHLLSVYLGLMCLAMAAAAAALWLYVNRLLRRRDRAPQRLAVLGRLADLESIERALRLTATIGFALITLMLLTGAVLASASPGGGIVPNWYTTPKVLLAVVVWVIYLVVMQAQYLASLRGRGAAMLAIAGFVLLIVVLGMAQALESREGGSARAAAPTAAAPDAGEDAGGGR